MTVFHADAYFRIGREHLVSGRPCQDYAIAGSSDSFSFGVVSDGCSSGGHTDVGARILALATSVAIQEYFRIHHGNFNEAVAQEIACRQNITLGGILPVLGLRTHDALATSAFVTARRDQGFVYVQGDGVVAFKYRNGNIRMTRISWQNEMPFYPAYIPSHIGEFINAHGGDSEIEALALETWLCEEGMFTGLGVTTIPIRKGICGTFLPFQPSLLQCAAVFSDGVAHIERFDWQKAVRECLAFKTFAGEFAKRRMMRFLREAKKNGNGPLDDIAYAVILTEKKKEDAVGDNHACL